MQNDNPVCLGKRERRQIERRKAILAVAERSFLEHGYAGTTMNSISAELGGSKGTLWSYFASKEELFAAVVEEETRAFETELRAALNPTAELRSALEEFCQRFMGRVLSARGIAFYRLIVGESGRSPELGRIFYERGPGVVERILAAYLTDRSMPHHLRPVDPIEMARFVLSMCVGGNHMRLVLGIDPPDGAHAAVDAKRVVDAFFAVYRAGGLPPTFERE